MDFSIQLSKLGFLGQEGVERLKDKTVGVVGLGALGSASATFLSRFPLGRLILIDRDVVEEKNLFRQFIYDVSDCRNRMPKARAAEARLVDIAHAEIDARDIHLDASAADQLFGECDLVLDATDNFLARFLMNEASVKHGKPWIYGGVLSTTGSAFFVDPETGPCLACAFPEVPMIGAEENCEAAGIFPVLPSMVASFQVTEAVKFLAGHGDKVERSFVSIEISEIRFRRMKILKDPGCRCCAGKVFGLLGRNEEDAVQLCGADTVMIASQKGRLDMKALAYKLSGEDGYFRNDYIIEFKRDGVKFVLHSDGRIFVHGAGGTKEAVTIASRVLGF